MISNEDKDKINKELTKDEQEIFDNMVNYFELTSNNLHIQIPYNFKNALENINNITLGSLSVDLKEIIPFKEKNKFYYYEDNKFTLNNILFLTSNLNENEKTEYILLNDLLNGGYIDKQDYLSDTGIKLNIITKEDDRKEIFITCKVNYEKFTENIINNLINKSKFEKAKKILENSIEYKNKELIGENLEFEIKIFSNSINKLLYTDNGEYLFDLQFPPMFRTNFLIDGTKLRPGLRKNEYSYYENIMFPFRNFQDEISNLKYRHFYILIKKENINSNNLNDSNDDDDYNNNNDSIEQLENYLGNLFANKNDIIDRKKFRHISKIKIINETEIKKNYYKNGQYELSDYFRYNSDEKIKIYKK